MDASATTPENGRHRAPGTGLPVVEEGAVSASRVLPWIVALLTLVVILAGVRHLDRAERERLQHKRYADTVAELGVLRARIESVLNAKLYAASGLAAYVASHPDLGEKEFQSIAQPLYHQMSGVESIRLARNAAISHIYPKNDGSEGDIGFDLLEAPKLRDAVRRAIAVKKTVMAGPLQVRPDAPVLLVSRTPIFLAEADGSPGNRLWGLTCIFMYRDALFEEVGLDGAVSTQRFALRGKDSLGAQGDAIWGDAALFARREAVLMDISLPNGSWQIAALPRAEAMAPAIVWLRSSGVVLAVLAAFLVWFLMRNPARLRGMVQHATAALRASEAKYRELAEQAPVAIFLLDRQGRCLMANPEASRMTGLSLADLSGRSLSDLVADDGRVDCFACLAMPADQKTLLAECLLRRPEGEALPVEIGARRLADGRTQVVLRDVSERKQIEALRQAHRRELEHAARLSAIGEMASGLAHELAQPLSAARNYVGACVRTLEGGKDGDRGGAEIGETLALAKGQLVRACDIVRHVKAFGRQQARSFAPLDVNALLRDVLIFLELETKQSGATIRLECGALPLVPGDRLRIEQVMVNLAKNALEALRETDPTRRELVIDTHADADRIEVSFRDTGCGLPADDEARPGTSYYTTKADGVGLGLSISRAIIEEHGGHLSLESRAQGGAIARFTLPVSAESVA